MCVSPWWVCPWIVCVSRVDVFLGCMSHPGRCALGFDYGVWSLEPKGLEPKGQLVDLSSAAVVVCGTFAAVPTLEECLSLKAQPIKAVYRIPGLGPQQLGECQPGPIEGEENLHSEQAALGVPKKLASLWLVTGAWPCDLLPQPCACTKMKSQDGTTPVQFLEQPTKSCLLSVASEHGFGR